MYRHNRINPQERHIVRNAVTLFVSVTALIAMPLRHVFHSPNLSDWFSRITAPEARFLTGLLLTLLVVRILRKPKSKTGGITVYRRTNP